MPYEVLDGGVSVDWDVVTRLIGIESRGGKFHVERGSIRVEPTGVLTSEDRAYLVARKPEVLKILNYRSPTP